MSWGFWPRSSEPVSPPSERSERWGESPEGGRGVLRLLGKNVAGQG
jgi:hypothetical protein